jgi:CheY-like chemotaxis protein
MTPPSPASAHALRAPGPGLDARWREIMERQVRNWPVCRRSLDVSRITRGKIELQKQSIDLAVIAARAVETTRPDPEPRHLLGVDPARAQALRRPLRVEQILANLLNNAAKYTPEGGQVDLEGEGDGVGVTLRVRDNGVGIDPDLLPRLFDLFQQGGNNSGGLGIGLTLVRTLVELHGGGVRASSAGPGRGSEFEIRLPVGEAPPIQGRGSGIRREARVEAHRALIVDDNVDAALLLAEALRQRGHVVHLAHDGKTAVEEAVRHLPTYPPRFQAPARSPSGSETTICESSDRVCIIAISGYGQAEYLTRSAEAGFSHHIVKPVDMAHLDALLTTLEKPNRG